MGTVEAKFSAKDVMALRQKTGLGMMDCKKAMSECNGDLVAAEDWLRNKLKGKMEKRTERPASEGRIGILIDGSNAVITEVRTETDFTAKNDKFIGAVDAITKIALASSTGAVASTGEIDKLIDDLRITTGENASFARGEKLEGGAFGSYLHHNGKTAAIIQIEGQADAELLAGVCMHIVAHDPTPIGVDEKDVPAATIDKIKADAINEAKESGKNDEIAQMIATGKVRKFLEETTLLNQRYVKDPTGKTAVKDVLPEGVTVTKFVQYIVGVD